MNETLVSASTAGLVEMIQTWRWSNKVLESASSLRSPSPLPPTPLKPTSWSQWRRPGVPAAVHGAQAALPHRRRPTWGWQFQGGIWPTCEICSPENFKVWICQRNVSVPYATNAFVLFETRQSNFFFQLPSACACFVREDFMLEFRFSRQKLESYITVRASKAMRVSNGI